MWAIMWQPNNKVANLTLKLFNHRVKFHKSAEESHCLKHLLGKSTKIFSCVTFVAYGFLRIHKIILVQLCMGQSFTIYYDVRRCSVHTSSLHEYIN